MSLSKFILSKFDQGDELGGLYWMKTEAKPGVCFGLVVEYVKERNKGVTDDKVLVTQVRQSMPKVISRQAIQNSIVKAFQEGTGAYGPVEAFNEQERLTGLHFALVTAPQLGFGQTKDQFKGVVMGQADGQYVLRFDATKPDSQNYGHIIAIARVGQDSFVFDPNIGIMKAANPDMDLFLTLYWNKYANDFRLAIATWWFMSIQLTMSVFQKWQQVR